jgi:hypothetical protein
VGRKYGTILAVEIILGPSWIEGRGTRGTHNPKRVSKLPLSFRTGNHQLPSISFTAQPTVGFDHSPKERERATQKV